MPQYFVKLLANGIVLIPLLMWFSEAAFWVAAMTSVVFSTFAYFFGDQMILRLSNNTVATLTDAALAYLFLWATAYYADWTLTWAELLTIAAVLGIVEAMLHRYFVTGDRAGQTEHAR